jgi:antirestriction protein
MSCYEHIDIDCTVKEAKTHFENEWCSDVVDYCIHQTDLLAELEDGILIAGISNDAGDFVGYVLISCSEVEGESEICEYQNSDFNTVDEVREYIDSEL